MDHYETNVCVVCGTVLPDGIIRRINGLAFCQPCTFDANRVCTALLDWVAGHDPVRDRLTHRPVPLTQLYAELLRLATLTPGGPRWAPDSLSWGATT